MNYVHKVLKIKDEMHDLDHETFMNTLSEEIDSISFLLNSIREQSDITINTSISGSFTKIIFLCHEILSNKLIPVKSKDASLDANPSLFKYLILYFKNIDSVRYIVNYHDDLEPNTKSVFFVLITIYERELASFVKELYKREFDKRLYSKDSIISLQRSRFQSLVLKLSEIQFPIKLNIFEDYEAFKAKRRIEIEQQDIDVFFEEKIERRPSEIRPQKSQGAQNLFYSYSLYAGTNYNPRLSFKRNPSNFVNADDEDINLLINYVPPKIEKKFNKEEDVSSGESADNDKSSFDHQIKEFEVKRKFDMEIKENYFRPKTERNTADIRLEEKNHVFNQNFEFKRRTDQKVYTKQDIISLNSKNIQVTNSLVMYLNHYFKKQEYYKFNNKCPDVMNTIDKDNYQCSNCFAIFEEKLLPPHNKIYWCSYFMRYICYRCFNDDYSVIPYFVLSNWDFSKYSISIKAKELLQKYYSAPIIHFKSNDPLIGKSSAFKTCLFYKRKIHKIFDIMKCKNAEEAALNILGKYKYLVLLENLFSLQDLMEMHSGTFLLKIKDFYSQFESHILRDCKKCEYKGDSCSGCLNDEKLFIYNIESVFFCKMCSNIYHRKCAVVHICIIEK